MEELGERIRELRAKLRLPRAEFALLIGISTTALFTYESGERTPGADVLKRICEETQATPQWLLTGQGVMYATQLRDVLGNVAAEIVANVLDETDVSLEQSKYAALIEQATSVLYKKTGLVPDDVKNATWPTEHNVRKKINELGGEGAPENPRTDSSSHNTQSANGSNIVQAGGNISGGINFKTTTKKVNVAITPPDGTIGANPSITERITTMFNELGLRREERFGKTAYPVMYNEFKKAFNISRNQKYTAYLLWPESRCQEIIDYLTEKLDNTIKGRIQKASARKGNNTKVLLGETSKLHKMLGWSEQEYRARLHYMFGVTTRADLSAVQLANYVAYLKEQVDARD